GATTASAAAAWMRTATPPASGSATHASATAVTIRSLVRNMAFRTPSVRAATSAETRPAAVWPATNAVAAWVVEYQSAGGRQAAAGAVGHAAAASSAAGPKP